MSAYGRITAGNILQQNKRPDCIQEELYLLIVACLCVNSVDSMSFLPMVILENDISNTVPMNKAKIALNVHLGLVV